MVLAYGEIEVCVMNLLQATLGGDTNTAVRALYRLRSESNRLEVADALIVPKLTPYLRGAWSEAYAAIKRCKQIRNQYAHGLFINDGGQLRFGDLDEAAQGKSEKSEIKLRPISLAALERQIGYFEYAMHQTLWIGDRYRIKTGQLRQIAQRVPKPKKVLPPKLDSHGEEQTHQ